MYEFDMIKNRATYKAHLDDIGVSTLPDQPGKRGFTAEEVKLHFKAPIDFLFALIGKNLNEMADVLAKYDLTIEEAQKEIKDLQIAIAKGVLFCPALQGMAPDPSQVKVWLDTSEGEETQEEIPKEELASASSESEAKAETLTLNEETGSLTFDDGQELKIFQENDESELASLEDDDQLSVVEENQEVLSPAEESDSNLEAIDSENEFMTLDS